MRAEHTRAVPRRHFWSIGSRLSIRIYVLRFVDFENNRMRRTLRDQSGTADPIAEQSGRRESTRVCKVFKSYLILLFVHYIVRQLFTYCVRCRRTRTVSRAVIRSAGANTAVANASRSDRTNGGETERERESDFE